MSAQQPDSTAVRVALWRALHVELDAAPHVLTDTIGLQLAAPDSGWRERPDMHPQWTSRMRASIVARARFIEDLVAEEAQRGVGQYVILGAGLDTFAQRRPELGSRLTVFEVERPGTQAWKQERLAALGLATPAWLRFVPVDFEGGASWWERLRAAGYDAKKPAVVASTGVAMYLSRDAIAETLRQIAQLAPGSTLAMSFLLPPELLAEEDRKMLEAARRGASTSGTPFVSFFAPDDLLALARESGLNHVEHVSSAELSRRYFTGRKDGLQLSSGEEFLVARI